MQVIKINENQYVNIFVLVHVFLLKAARRAALEF